MGGGTCSVRSHDTMCSSSSSASASSEASPRHRRPVITAAPLFLFLLQTTVSFASSFVIPSSTSSFLLSPSSTFPSHHFLSRSATIKKIFTTRTPVSTPVSITALHVKNDKTTSSSISSSSSSSSSTASKKPKKKQSRSTTIPVIDEESEKPADIAGAEFFGGRAVKEELFDPEEEERAALQIELEKQQSLKQQQVPPTLSSATTTVAAGETTAAAAAAAAVQEKKEKSGDDTATDLTIVSELLEYHRFDDKTTFPDELSKNLAMSLQKEINSILYLEDEEPNTSVDSTSSTSSSSSGSTSLYDPNDMQWITPFPRSQSSSSTSTSTTPLEELVNAMEFYNRIDIAIVAAKTITDDHTATAGASTAGTSSSSSASSKEEKQVEIKWEISLVWPNFWEGRVLLTGASILSVQILDDNGNNMKIIKQIDQLDNNNNNENDVLKAVGTQFLPRFWDVYHIGMTPSAELMPRLDPSSFSKKGLFSSYKVMELPPRLVLQPSILDYDGRNSRWAQAIPNHAFATVIKTMGPKRQRYVLTTPVEVGITRVQDGGKKSTAAGVSKITWSIPIPPELLSNEILPLPGPDRETDPTREPECPYVYRGRRRVATLPFGGNPQDEDVSEVRKQLYEQVVRDGLKPKLDENGRPIFFFWQNEAKACFTDGGLGMAVYEWRPKFIKSNEVGIELEL